jgi:iron complex transport system ATP-binding protein
VEPILTLKNVGFGYGQGWHLKGISLRVGEGEILGILGPNGSGKSTLIKIMDGMLVPQEGQILIKNRSLARLGRSSLAKEIAMVAQENHFRFSFSALEVVLMGRFPHLKRWQFEGERDLEVALNALSATHSLELAERSIHELSGGERQRVLIARALAQEAKIILLDEPTSFLDLKYKREIFRLISSLSREKGLSVVVVSHDIDLAAQYCQRVMMLKDGSIFEMGEPDRVITASNIEAVYECPVLVDKNPATGRPRVSLQA